MTSATSTLDDAIRRLNGDLSFCLRMHATDLARERLAIARFLARNCELLEVKRLAARARPFLPGSNQHVPVRSAIEILKLVDSLEYQSCEHPEWERSEARKCLHRITGFAVSQLPGYAIAPWSI